ncbi:MAG TPA: Sir2 family NAD-dependent protein deacetylase [Kofleriaceae bacterium]|jgi:NAD-dependent deacetylase
MRLGNYRSIVVLTGAGISRAAGLATYRGPGGLWSDPELEALLHVDSLRTQREAATAMFWTMHEAVARAEPTAAHRALAEFEARSPGELMIVTQNVDGLHQRAGSRNVVEYHGSLRVWLCEQCKQRLEPPLGAPPACCGERMRPDAVLFGEMIPASAEHAVTRALRDCDLFVAIGTSGTVWPAAGFVRSAEYSGAHTMLLNLELDDDARSLYRECHTGPADELVAHWFAS